MLLIDRFEKVAVPATALTVVVPARVPLAGLVPIAIVTEAGGQVSDPGGGPFVPETGRILASNGKIHQAMLDELLLIQKARPTESAP